MTHDELRALAEAARDVQDGGGIGDFYRVQGAYSALAEAANPDAVLALLDEIDALTSELAAIPDDLIESANLLAAATVRRDRYREALERIAHPPTNEDYVPAVHIASRALSETGEPMTDVPVRIEADPRLRDRIY